MPTMPTVNKLACYCIYVVLSCRNQASCLPCESRSTLSKQGPEPLRFGAVVPLHQSGSLVPQGLNLSSRCVDLAMMPELMFSKKVRCSLLFPVSSDVWTLLASASVIHTVSGPRSFTPIRWSNRGSGNMREKPTPPSCPAALVALSSDMWPYVRCQRQDIATRVRWEVWPTSSELRALVLLQKLPRSGDGDAKLLVIAIDQFRCAKSMRNQFTGARVRAC